MGDKKMTPEKIADFLSRLSECGNVTRAAEESGCSRVQLYTLRSERPEFFEAWEKAAKIGAARLEDEARRRAVEGWQEPVWYQGEEVGAVRKYSDTLLICLLKAHHPEKYADRSENKTTLSGAVEISHSLAPELQSVLDSVYGAQGQESAK